MEGKWVRCTACNEVAHFTEYDQAAFYLRDEDTEEVKEVSENDREKFLLRHRGHPLEELTVLKGSFIGGGRYSDPMRESYAEATNGKERFIIKRWRDNINSPLRYEIIPGSIVTSIRVGVQSREIRKQMRAELNCPPLKEAQNEQFIKIVEKVATRFPLKIDQEVMVETDTPLVSYCSMSKSAIKQILRLSRKIFDPVEMVEVEHFIHRNNQDGDPMTLLITREISIRKPKRKKDQSEKQQTLLSGKDVAHRGPR